MGFLIEILGDKETSPGRRDLISEEELLKTHSKEMYNYLKSTLRYEIKVPVKKSEMMSPNFDEFLDQINRHQLQQQQAAQPEKEEASPANPSTPKVETNGKGKLSQAKPVKVEKEETPAKENAEDEEQKEEETNEDVPMKEVEKAVKKEKEATQDPQDLTEGEVKAALSNTEKPSQPAKKAGAVPIKKEATPIKTSVLGKRTAS